MASEAIRPDFPFMNIGVADLTVRGQPGELQTFVTRPAFNFVVRPRQVEPRRRVGKLGIAQHLP